MWISKTNFNKDSPNTDDIKSCVLKECLQWDSWIK